MDIQWYPGHMAKAKREVAADIKLVDMVFEVADARIPVSSRNRDLLPVLGNKPVIVVLNKADLADPAVTKQWLNFYRQNNIPAVALQGAKKQGVKDLLAVAAKLAEPVMQALEAKGRNRRLARAMVVGIPNTGKSTVINALSPQAIAKTANKPGITKANLWIKAGGFLELLDTPGILWPKFADQEMGFRLAVTGAISDTVFDRYAVACKLAAFLRQEYPQALLKRYKTESLPEGAEELLRSIGKKRGLLLAGGTVNTESAAMMLLTEFRNGKLGRFSLEKPEKY